MKKESKSENLKLVNVFYFTILVLDFSRKTCVQMEGPYIIEEVYTSGAIKTTPKELVRRWLMDIE